MTQPSLANMITNELIDCNEDISANGDENNIGELYKKHGQDVVTMIQDWLRRYYEGGLAGTSIYWIPDIDVKKL